VLARPIRERYRPLPHELLASLGLEVRDVLVVVGRTLCGGHEALVLSRLLA
jgi:hypothetical protein